MPVDVTNPTSILEKWLLGLFIIEALKRLLHIERIYCGNIISSGILIMKLINLCLPVFCKLMFIKSQFQVLICVISANKNIKLKKNHMSIG